MKTSELIGPALDWAVARSLGIEVSIKTVAEQAANLIDCVFVDGSRPNKECVDLVITSITPRLYVQMGDGMFIQRIPSYSTDWSHGGPIIEREGIEVVRGNDLYFPKGNEKGDHYELLWLATLPLMDLPQGYRFHGPTPLISAMRCFVASKLGDEVEIPNELA